MPIPRPPSPPPLPALPIPDSDDVFASQQPLCTPVDQLIVHKDNVMPPSPPSPVRTTVKRRRTSALNVMSAGNLFDQRLSQPVFTQPPRPPLLASDDDPTRPPAITASQRADLPEMSQDTLALFPRIVQEHHMMIRPFDNMCDSQQSFDAVPQRRPSQPRRHSDPTSGLLAKASLFNTLSSASSMLNPFRIPATPPAKQPPRVTPYSDKNFAIRKVPNASESFQNMEPVLDFDDADPSSNRKPPPPARPSPATLAAREKNIESKEEKMKKLKVLLVSSSHGRRLSIDFEVVRVAGKGAFSEVLEVKHRLDGCTYAVKRNSLPMLADKARMENLQEVFALSALQGHPNILRYHDAWFEDRGRVLHMQTEYLPEGSLFSHYIEDERAMPLDELFALATDISSALSFMHSKGIAHLDVKPDNIFRCTRGMPRDSFIIGDFGLACHHDGTDARSTEGDSRYLCPEALGGSTTPQQDSITDDDVPPSDDEKGAPEACPRRNKRKASSSASFDLRPRDIFSLGATIYELATGIPLAKSGPEWVNMRSNTKKVAKEAGAKCGSAELAHILKICLEPDPRYRASASELVEICKAHDVPESSRYVEKLRKERDEAIRQCRRFDQATSFLLKNGEGNRRRYRENCAQRSKVHLPRSNGLQVEQNGV